MNATRSIASDQLGQREPLLEQLKRESVQLREQRAKLAALVDHYFAAYREAIALVERRDRELAEVRRLLQAKPIITRR